MDDKYGMSGPPPPGFHAPPPYTDVPSQSPPVTVTTLNIVNVGPTSTALVCPSCHATVATRVEHSSSTRTHMIAALLCIFMLWPCVCIPYCLDSCKNANHYCPNCHAYLGTYQS